MGQPIGPNRIMIRVVLAALFASGVAGIINQVVWQRALKIFLGGGETISALVVVMVFMLGLGIGSGWMARRAGRFSHPLRVFARLELLLFATNAGIALLLSLDLTETVYAAERVMLALGIPLRLIYALAAFALLLVPTTLMGATMPVASEACQRQLGATESALVTRLFFINTAGAVLGAFGASLLLLPVVGQRTALLAAAAFNLLAGIAVAGFSRRVLGATRRGGSAAGTGEALREKRGAFRPEEVLGFGLGLLALGYEMYLLRLMPMLHEPLPYTFALTLCFFLLFWSVGVYLAPRAAGRLRTVFLAGIFLVLAMPFVYRLDRDYADFSVLGGGLVYFLPCVCFGLLYGALVARGAAEWGRDVGRFYAINTAGAILGIAFFNLAGYEISQDLNALIIAVGLVGLVCYLVAVERRESDRAARGWRWAQAVAALLMVGIFVAGWRAPYTEEGDLRTFWGRDGVVELHPNGDVFIDGMWHSRLSTGTSHIGRPYSWFLALAAVLAHRDEPIRDALVIGDGIGITASTIALLDDLEVDAYEINRTLQRVLREYPEATLGVADNPRVHIYWQDARSGLALNPKTYDVIISAPVYFRQAGSSILLSREYFSLIQQRLKPRGVVAIYSREDEREQELLVGRTIRSVFPYVETFLNGLLTVASDSPIVLGKRAIEERLGRSDPLYQQAQWFDRSLRGRTGRGIEQFVDVIRRRYPEGPLLVRDDHPLVEYPWFARHFVTER